MVKKYSKFVFVFIFSLLLITIFCFVDKAFADKSTNENVEKFNYSGIVYEYGTTKPVVNAFVSGWFYNDEGAQITDDVYTDESGRFTITQIPEGCTGQIQFVPPADSKLLDNRIQVNDEIHSDIENQVVNLHPYTTNISGSVLDSNGNGISGIYLEFYNPCSLKSPSPDVRVYTDENGNFDITKNRKSFGDESFYDGLSVGVNYFVSVISVPTTWPAQDPKKYPTNFLSRTVEMTFDSQGKTDIVFDNMQKITNINIFDRDQGETTFFDMFIHKFYINGKLQNDGGLVGDTQLTIKGDFDISIAQDNALKFTYNHNGEIHEDIYEPILVSSSEGWIPGDQIRTQKANNWVIWTNNKGPEQKCYSNYSKHFGSDINFVDLDVDFVDATPLSFSFNDKTSHKNFHYLQTFDNNKYEYDNPDFSQNNVYKGSTICVDNNNNLVIKSNVATNDKEQSTIVCPIAVEGKQFASWKYEGKVLTTDSEQIIAQDKEICIEVDYADKAEPDKPSSDLQNVQGNPAQTSDYNFLFALGIIFIILISLNIGIVELSKNLCHNRCD